MLRVQFLYCGLQKGDWEQFVDIDSGAEFDKLARAVACSYLLVYLQTLNWDASRYTIHHKMLHQENVYSE